MLSPILGAVRAADYHFLGDLKPGEGALSSGLFFRPVGLGERFARWFREVGVVGSCQDTLPETETSGILAQLRGSHSGHDGARRWATQQEFDLPNLGRGVGRKPMQGGLPGSTRVG
jgi:hypothetical protein